MLGLDRDSVEIHPYDKEWANEYNKEKQILDKYLKGIEYRMEHVGSTSIPGLSAKPIIDIAIGTNDEDTAIKIADILMQEGYDIENSLSTKGEIFAAKGGIEFRTHYIHIQKIGSTYWNNFMYFKKYLLDHPKTIQEYGKLKNKLSLIYKNDRKKYTASKNEFISSILDKAHKMYKL